MKRGRSLIACTLVSSIAAGCASVLNFHGNRIIAQDTTPLWQGMPEELPGDILSSSFLPIQEFRPNDPSLVKPFIPPPLGDEFVINGTPIATQGRTQLHQFFSESVFINIP